MRRLSMKHQLGCINDVGVLFYRLIKWVKYFGHDCKYVPLQCHAKSHRTATHGMLKILGYYRLATIDRRSLFWLYACKHRLPLYYSQRIAQIHGCIQSLKWQNFRFLFDSSFVLIKPGELSESTTRLETDGRDETNRINVRSSVPQTQKKVWG